MATDMLTDKSGKVEVVAFCTFSQVGDILSAQRRDSEQEFSVILDEPFRYIVQGDSFMGVTTHSKNPELAKAFVEWFYSEAWYPGYLSYISSASSMSNFPKDKDPILAEADAAQPDGVMVMYDGGGDNFTAIQNETAFDYKKLGAQMFTENFDLDAALAQLDTKWAAARAKLGIE